MPSFYELLKYAKTGIAAPDMTAYDKLRALAMAGGAKYPVRTITGVPPLPFKADGRPLISWSMLGNGQQTGTPSPDNIIMPEFVGVRTGNLFDPNSTRYHMGKVSNNQIGRVSNGAMFYIRADADMTYTIKVHTSDATFVRLYLSDAPIVDGVSETYNAISESETVENPEVSITNTNYKYLWIQTGGTWYTEHGGSSIMLNTGSTALPYEPYGWAENITSAGQTTTVYLGEVPTVRRVRKLVMDGTEEWYLYSTGTIHQFYTQGAEIGGVAISSAYSTVAPYGMTVNYRNGDYGCYTVSSGSEIAFQMYGSKDVFPAQTEWKSYLASQYAAGTPVTVWYVLATPTTGIINEPLAKIGTYADELHSEDAAVTIPTVRGSNVLTVETDLQPSSVSITGHIEQT